VTAVLRSGQNLAKQEGRNVPLMYMWHGKYYLGGAHGIAGILYMLLQVKWLKIEMSFPCPCKALQLARGNVHFVSFHVMITITVT
jgi:hypothetical protein